MKLKIYLKEFILFTFVAIMFGCSGDSDGEDNQVQSETSITISTLNLNVATGNEVAFTVVNNLSSDVTSQSTFIINDQEVSSNVYIFPSAGQYEVVAKYSNFTSNTLILNVEQETSIMLQVNKSEMWNGETVAFTVLNNLSNNVTNHSTFYIDGQEFPGSIYNSSITGVHTVYAVKNGLISNELEFISVESTHTTKVIVEDYTGTWCGYCPRLAIAIDNAVMQNDNVVPVAIHDDNDMMFPYTNQLESTFGVTGFPTGKVNRTTTWDESSNQPINLLSVRKKMGLAINSSISGNNINAEIKVHYDLGETGSQRLVVYLLENGLVFPQENYYNSDPSSPWYQTGNPIQNFAHNHVARQVFTNVFGDVIPSSETTTGNTYEVDYSMIIPSSVQNNDNLEIVAFVVDFNGTVLNVQHADVGEDKDFD